MILGLPLSPNCIKVVWIMSGAEVINQGYGGIESPAPSELVSELASFDDSLRARIHALEVERVVGSSFGARLDTELQPQGIDEEAVKGFVELIDSYRWALALAAYPYRSLEDQDSVSISTVSGLFSAVREYDSGQEPDFLTHLSKTLAAQMLEDHGVPPEPAVISPADFDGFVVRNYLSQLPSLPNERLPEHVSEDEVVLVIEEDRLVSGIVREVTDRERMPPYILNTIPENDLPELQARLDSMLEELKREGSRITLADPAAGPDEIAEFEAMMNPKEDEATPRVELLHALGRAPLWLYVRYPQMVVNPEAASTALVATEANPEGIAVEIKHSRLIPEAAWKSIISNPIYREIYLERGTAGDAEQKAVLEQAILARKQAGGTTIEPLQTAHQPRRARAHRPTLMKARANASIDE